MTLYCPNCYVGVKPEDAVCKKCGTVLRPELIPKEPDVKPEEAAAADLQYSQEAPKVDFSQAVSEQPAEQPAEQLEVQPVVQSESPQPAGEADKSETISLGQWMLILLLTYIPIVNLVMLIIWAVSDKNRSKMNFSRAQLIWIGIRIVLCLIFTFMIVAMIRSAMASLSNMFMNSLLYDLPYMYY